MEAVGEVLGWGFEGWWRRLRRCVGGGWGGEGRQVGGGEAGDEEKA